MLEQQGEMWSSMNGGDIAIIAGIIAAFVIGFLVIKLWKRLSYRVSAEFAEKQKVMSYAKPLTEEDNGHKEEDKPGDLVGEGLYKAYVLRDNCLEPTHIKEPIGNLFTADTSMPVSGACYLVQVKDNKLVPYDPRQVPFESKSSPQWAYFATHWGIVGEVYMSIKNWWQMAPAWVAIASVAAAILIVMVVLG